MKLSLSMITKNAEDTIRPCLISIIEHVDEVVVVDTGSSDGTVEAILAVAPKTKIIRWDDPNKHNPEGWISDFAFARNLSLANTTGDVVLWLDADDVVEHKGDATNPGSALRSLAETFFVHHGPPADVIEMRYDYKRDPWGNSLVDLPRYRIFRKGAMEWIWPVHEDLKPTKPMNQVSWMNGNEFILHRKKEKDDRKAAERNLWIMNRYMNAGGEMNPRLFSNVAGSLLALGQPEQAIAYFGQAIQDSAGDPEQCYLYHLRRGDAYNKLGVFNSAMADFASASLIFPSRRHPFIALAEVAMNIGDASRALSYCDLVDAMGEKTEEGFVQQTTSLTSVPTYTRARAFMALGRYPEAQAAYKALLQRFPGAEELAKPLEGLKQMEARHGDYEAIKRASELAGPEVGQRLLRSLPEDLKTFPEVARALRPPRPKKKPVLAFWCGPANEPWGPSSLAKGIGGSEEAVVLLSREMAALGWRVEVYGFPSAADQGTDEHGVVWLPYSAWDVSEPCDVFVGWRQYRPNNAFSEGLDKAASQSWLWLHDTIQPECFGGGWASRLTGIFCLSESHALDLPESLKDKLVLTQNGLNKDYFAFGANRANQFVYASSPDRGLEMLLEEWPAIHAQIPGSRLHVYYGFTHYYRLAAAQNENLRRIKQRVEHMAKSHGVVWHGMVGQKELAEGFAACGFLLYPCIWSETSCITGMKAQAMGAIPITSRYLKSSLPETIRYDLGPPAREGMISADPAWRAEWSAAVVAATQRTDLGPMRAEMIKWARSEFSWSKIARQWNSLFRTPSSGVRAREATAASHR